jgi:AcrR family transcriptional regulator
MPRQVDHGKRRLEIIQTAKELIAEGGLAAVSFREIGRRMGGSTTLVTHYYATQQELLLDVSRTAVEDWRTELLQIEEEHPDPVERLHTVLFEWMLPLTGEELTDERTRINLLAANIQGTADTHEILDTYESGVRDVLRGILRKLVPAGEVDHGTDMLRVAFNGLALSAVEHPDYWTPERQARVMRSVVEGMGLPMPANNKRSQSTGTPARAVTRP